jgi:hypothetical protein
MGTGINSNSDAYSNKDERRKKIDKEMNNSEITSSTPLNDKSTNASKTNFMAHTRDANKLNKGTCKLGSDIQH